MKVAVCFSGLCRYDPPTCIETYKTQFGSFDFFFSTWTERSTDIERQLPDVSYITTPSPTNHYHPHYPNVAGLDSPLQNVCRERFNKQNPSPDWIKKAEQAQKTHVKGVNHTMSQEQHRYLKSRTSTNQMLGHAFLVSQLPAEYDMIIRARYDALVSDRVDFAPLLEYSYQNQCAVGFSGGIGYNGRKFDRPKYSFNKLTRIKKKYPPMWINDLMIFHPRNILDTDNVKQLHDTSCLLPSETGWYQVLAHPTNTYKNIIGGVQVIHLFSPKDYNSPGP